LQALQFVVLLFEVFSAHCAEVSVVII